jgi:CheY-like chemotaxis protein
VKTILVVDDELASAEVLSLILEEEGYRTFCAANGQHGLAACRTSTRTWSCSTS